MAKRTETRTLEYDAEGRIVRETVVTETEDITYPAVTYPATVPGYIQAVRAACAHCAHGGICGCVLSGPTITCTTGVTY